MRVAKASTPLLVRHDGVLLAISFTRLGMTNDTYLVQPIVLLGGTIGDLAVNGIVTLRSRIGGKRVLDMMSGEQSL